MVGHLGKIHAVVNILWVSKEKLSRIDVQILNATMVLFRIEVDVVCFRVLSRKYWHVADVPLRVCEWTAGSSQTKAVWVDFLGNRVDKAIKLYPITEGCTRLDVTRVLVKVNLQKPLPKVINLTQSSDVKSFIPISFL